MTILFAFSWALNIFLCICCYYLASELKKAEKDKEGKP